MQTLARDVHSSGHLQYSSIPRLQHPVSQWEGLHTRLEKCDKCQWRDLCIKFWVFWGVEQSQKWSRVKSGQVSGRIYTSFFLYGRYPTNVWYQHWENSNFMVMSRFWIITSLSVLALLNWEGVILFLRHSKCLHFILFFEHLSVYSVHLAMCITNIAEVPGITQDDYLQILKMSKCFTVSSNSHFD